MSESTESRKRVAFFDVDNTLLHGSSLYLLGRGMYRRGYFSKHDIVTFMLANLRFRLNGEAAIEIDKYQKAACEFIKGHSVKDLEGLAAEVYDEFVSPKLWQGAIEIANQHLIQGEEVWLVTATPLEMAQLIADRLGFTGALGTQAEAMNGSYTGNLIGNLLHGKEKAIAVRELAERDNVDLSNSYAYSDSHHDLPLLEAVGNPRAINPDTLLQIRAIRDHWPIHEFRRARWLKNISGAILARAAIILKAIGPKSQINPK